MFAWLMGGQLGSIDWEFVYNLDWAVAPSCQHCQVSERTKKNIPSSNNVLPRKNASPGTVSNSFAAVLKSGSVNHNIVNDHPCHCSCDALQLMERDFSCSLMGKMKDINALSNLFIILANEGFENVKLFYLGGQWVLLELDSVTSKEKITNHVGVGSWFEVLKPALILLWVWDETYSEWNLNGYNENDRGSDNEHVSETSFAHENVVEFQDLTERRMLWDFIHHLIDSWDGECVLLGDFNEVRFEHERRDYSVYCGLIISASHDELKLDRFLISDGYCSNFLPFRFTRIGLKFLDKILRSKERCKDDQLHVSSNLLKEVADFNQVFFASYGSKAKFGDKMSVWDCGISKSPGPDGFTFEFYRKYWSLIDHDVVAAVTSFFSTGSFPPGCNSSFITLIPKSQEAKMVKDFRPISLIGSMYKIITKVLANRLSLVISELIDGILFNLSLVYDDDVIMCGNGIHHIYQPISIGYSILHPPFKLFGVKGRWYYVEISSWEGSHWKLLLDFLNGSSNPSGLVDVLLSSKSWYFFNGVGKCGEEDVVVGWNKILDLCSGIRGALDISSSYSRRSPWLDIVNEVRKLASKGIDLLSLVKKKVGNDPSGDFSVKSTREFIDDSMLPKTDVPTRWVKSIPIKINIFAWRVSLDKLPTRLNLSLRGLDIPSIICPLCSIAVESTSHLIFSCQLARQLMIKVVHWWDLSIKTFTHMRNWPFWFKNLQSFQAAPRDVFEGVCLHFLCGLFEVSQSKVILGATSLV
ncbi:RNA-directed DNA polymerase, eukaryota [Tanacetum coccineum]